MQLPALRHDAGRAASQHDITVDECPSCGGLWLDKGEFEHIAGREQEGYFGRLLRERLGGRLSRRRRRE